MTSRLYSWDVPVVEALDQVETLPGLDPARVEWDQFRFFGEGDTGRMHRVVISAYPDGAGDLQQRLRFRADTEGRFEVLGTRKGEQARPLSLDDVAQALQVSRESAGQCVALIEPALHQALHAWNDTNAVPRNSRHMPGARRPSA